MGASCHLLVRLMDSKFAEVIKFHLLFLCEVNKCILYISEVFEFTNLGLCRFINFNLLLVRFIILVFLSEVYKFIFIIREVVECTNLGLCRFMNYNLLLVRLMNLIW